MKSLVELLVALLHDCGRVSGVPTSRDVETLRERVKHEGDSFLTITLPSFSVDFERSLAEKSVVPGFSSFKKEKSGIPSFLKGFLYRVFDSRGALRTDPSVDCIRAVRQICLFCKKVQRPCSGEREAAAAEAYVKCDCEVTAEPQGVLWDLFGKIADVINSELDLSTHDWMDEFVPRHGPGATRESITGNQKWNFRRWHLRLEWSGIKYWRYGKATSYPSYTHSNPLPVFVAPRDEEPVRVVFVPKTLKSPRVIAVEPVCMQYAQQGLARILMRRVERSTLAGGHVNFRDQSVNQKLAREASGHGLLATLDLSEASDRVGLVHVERLFKNSPKFLEWVLACRSSRAQLPNGEVIHLEKFASMGSALCFPVESLVFFVSILASIVSRLGLPLSRRLLRSLAEDVYVYGDDLVVPSDMAPLIAEDLETLGFRVNRRKSFWTGQFRESCGEDCFGSERVTPVYLRRDFPTDQADVSGLLSNVATANQLYLAGYTKAADALRQRVEAVFGALPQVPVDSPAIGWYFHSEVVPPMRWNALLQRREYLHWVPVPLDQADRLVGEQALAKCFRIIGADQPPDSTHLTRSVRPYALTRKRRWVPNN